MPTAKLYAAGIMFVDPGGDVLFLKRSATGDHVGAWCLPGGCLEDGEAAEEAAMREAVEEIGILPAGSRQRLAQHLNDEGVDFTTFLQQIDEKFIPKLDKEHTAFAWSQPDQAPEPLHPGLKRTIDDMALDSPEVPDNIHIIRQKTGRDEQPNEDKFTWNEGDIEMLPDEEEEVDPKDIPEGGKTIHIYEDKVSG